MAQTSVASNKPKVELDLHAHTCVVGDNCLVIHHHDRPVMSSVSIQKMAISVTEQSMLQYPMTNHILDRNTS